MKKFILIDLKHIDPENLETQNVKTIILSEDELKIHQRIGSELLNDKHIEEYIEDEQPKAKEKKIEPIIEVPLEIEDVPESEVFEPFILQPLENFVDNSEPKIDFGENIIPKIEPEKPKKSTKQRIKATK